MKKDTTKGKLIISIINYIVEIIAYTILTWGIAVEKVGQTAIIVFLIILILIAANVIMESIFLAEESKFIQSYWTIMKDLIQTMIPLVITGLILFITKSEGSWDFFINNFSVVFVIGIIIVALLALLLVTLIVTALFYWIKKIVHK